MRRGLVAMSCSMSAAIWSRRSLLERSSLRVPQRAFSLALATSKELLEGTPARLQSCLGHLGQSCGMSLEPLIDLLLGGDALVDVAGFVAKVDDHAVGDGFVE